MSSPGSFAVSVIVPNYNHARFLRRRMDSILSQNVRDMEIVLLDDASTDDSLAIASDYAARDARIRIVRNEFRIGNVFAQWNRGVELTTGRYLWIAESDDYAAPGLLEALAARLDAHPAAGLSYCNSWLVDENDVRVGSMAGVYRSFPGGERWTRDFVNNGASELRQHLAALNTIPNASAVLVRRDAYLSAGGADPSFSLCGDWLLWSRILRRWDVAYCAEPLNLFRRHGATVRESAETSCLHVREMCAVAEDNLAAVDIPPETLRRFRENLARQWVRSAARHPAALESTAAVLALTRRLDPWIRFRLARQIARHAAMSVLGKESASARLLLRFSARVAAGRQTRAARDDAARAPS